MLFMNKITPQFPLSTPIENINPKVVNCICPRHFSRLNISSNFKVIRTNSCSNSVTSFLNYHLTQNLLNLQSHYAKINLSGCNTILQIDWKIQEILEMEGQFFIQVRLVTLNLEKFISTMLLVYQVFFSFILKNKKKKKKFPFLFYVKTFYKTCTITNELVLTMDKAKPTYN